MAEYPFDKYPQSLAPRGANDLRSLQAKIFAKMAGQPDPDPKAWNPYAGERVMQGAPVTSLGGLVGLLAGGSRPAEGVSYGMIPTLRNLKEFEKLKEKAIWDNPYLRHLENYIKDPKTRKNIEDQMSFLHARYPRRMGVPNNITPEYPGLTPEGTPNTGSLEVVTDIPNNKAISTRLKLNPYALRPNIERISLVPEIVTHETQHAVDIKRKGLEFLNRGRSELEKEFNKPNLSNETLDYLYDKYNRIPSEVTANKAGSTANKAWLKYLDLRRQQK